MSHNLIFFNVVLSTESLTREREKVDTLNENILKEKVRYSQSSSSNIFQTRKTMFDHISKPKKFC